MLSWILGARSISRSLQAHNADTVLVCTLYKSLVRSKLEYCCPLWDPTAVSDILKREKIKMGFTSKVEGCIELTYWERLKYLKILFSAEGKGI